MFITNHSNTSKGVGMKKYLQEKLEECCAFFFLQPHVIYCNVCKAVDGTHFVGNSLCSDLAPYDQNIVMMEGHYRVHRFDLYKGL